MEEFAYGAPVESPGSPPDHIGTSYRQVGLRPPAHKAALSRGGNRNGR